LRINFGNFELQFLVLSDLMPTKLTVLCLSFLMMCILLYYIHI
jgi:hypothetical protein